MPNTPAAPENPVVVTLCEIFLAGEYAAVARLISEGAMAPTTADRVALLRMTGSEINHFQVLAEQVTAAGRDVADAVDQHVDVFNRYHKVTDPSTWLEVLVKMYIGDGMSADFFAEMVDHLPEEVRDTFGEVMADTSSSEWACEQVRAAVTGDPAVAAPLTLWGRRLLGEAITHMQWVLAEDPDVTDLLFSGTGSLTDVASFFDSIAERHGERMRALGLA